MWEDYQAVVEMIEVMLLRGDAAVPVKDDASRRLQQSC